MALEFAPQKQSLQPPAQEEPLKSPVLKAEDEAFLARITSDSLTAPSAEDQTVIFDNTPAGKNAQLALMDGADQVPLPATPVDERGNPVENKEVSDKEKKKKKFWSFLPNVPTFGSKGKEKQQAGSELLAAAEVVKMGGIDVQKQASEEEQKDEQKELTGILDRLNLSAINNRAFSFSKESQKLMDEFTQILKDCINGVPTAYDDLEKFLTSSDKQIRGLYGDMPPFLQTLIKGLPSKLGLTLVPELLASTSDKPGADGQKMGIKSDSLAPGASKGKKKRNIPSLKSIVKSEGAIAGILRTIVNFLRLRFPLLVTGTNVILSMAVFCKSLFISKFVPSANES